jgi:hypothetical protein
VSSPRFPKPSYDGASALTYFERLRFESSLGFLLLEMRIDERRQTPLLTKERSHMDHSEQSTAERSNDSKLYSVPALACFANVDRRVLRRVLRCNGVPLVRRGRALYVTLPDLRERLPALWKSLRLIAKLRGDEGWLQRAARAK